MKENFITTVQQMYDFVMETYKKNDVELNGCHFDFSVKMSEKDILKGYAILQHDINGDMVVRLNNPNMINSNGDTYIYGTSIKDTLSDSTKIYSGNCEKFLSQFNDCELKTGLCRVDELEETEFGEVGGLKFDFVL